MSLKSDISHAFSSCATRQCRAMLRLLDWVSCPHAGCKRRSIFSTCFTNRSDNQPMPRAHPGTVWGTKAKPLVILNPMALAALLSALTKSGHQSWYRQRLPAASPRWIAIRRASSFVSSLADGRQSWDHFDFLFGG